MRCHVPHPSNTIARVSEAEIIDVLKQQWLQLGASSQDCKVDARPVSGDECFAEVSVSHGL